MRQKWEEHDHDGQNDNRYHSFPNCHLIELVTTFLPAPGIDQMKSKGYSFWTVKGEGEIVRSYFMKANS